MPALFTHVFPNLVWHIPSSERVIYLTFDDGPTPEITDWTLKVLDDYNAKATFFCIGKNVKSHPALFSKISTGGHGIGNHTFNHIKGWKSSHQDYLDNVSKASEYINSKLFRPPYGQIRPKQAAALVKKGYRVIMWNILSLDWDASISKEKCAENVIKNSQSGDIIVFHDSLKAATNLRYALPKVLQYFSEEGFKFRRIPGSIQ
ncbi:MAG: polysaccharide deacetylase family protein [Bacteroidia bacterium]|nr:polysaccharide deacetylase family protein [Bacteroidia bacterium]NND25011.1 polysaccharide deacetylase family protein [Flavobacteriaceae bacterium]MBT8278569.1 polysaccharide deacetylase family protein [Bacteroidia bacterium]NNK59537.1 polysaccharide deacetylase family protein [Flavobacteriaceae bacterium]NNL32498.1 polysaccharide deacetylase family protein [Flavobacteriaceae bacterium]